MKLRGISKLVPFLSLLLAYGACLLASEIRWRLLIPSGSRFAYIDVWAPLAVVVGSGIYLFTARRVKAAIKTIIYGIVLLFVPVSMINHLTDYNVYRKTWHTASTRLPGSHIRAIASMRSATGGIWTWLPSPAIDDHKQWEIRLQREDRPQTKPYKLEMRGGMRETELYITRTAKGPVLEITDSYTSDGGHFIDLRTLSKTRCPDGPDQPIGKFSWMNGALTFHPATDAPHTADKPAAD